MQSKEPTAVQLAEEYDENQHYSKDYICQRGRKAIRLGGTVVKEMRNIMSEAFPALECCGFHEYHPGKDQLPAGATLTASVRRDPMTVRPCARALRARAATRREETYALTDSMAALSGPPVTAHQPSTLLPSRLNPGYE